MAQNFMGAEYWSQGSVVSLDLEHWLLYTDKPGRTYPNAEEHEDIEWVHNTWGNKSNAFVVTMDSTQTFYKVLLDNRFFWFPVVGATLVTESRDHQDQLLKLQP